jgi:hypothetical protein
MSSRFDGIALDATVLAAEEAHRKDPHTESSEWPHHLAEAQDTLSTAKNHLEPDRYDDAWNRGLQMTSAEALDHALDTLATGSA